MVPLAQGSDAGGSIRNAFAAWSAFCDLRAGSITGGPNAFAAHAQSITKARSPAPSGERWVPDSSHVRPRPRRSIVPADDGMDLITAVETEPGTKRS